tara:strand:+ start:287 stop:1069 length:783 start_codon:yes stop_codon:yes gene_type:complete
MAVTINGSTGVGYADNIKHKLGTGDDLEIYHDGSHSRIKESGTGYLIINTDTGVLIKNGADNENIAVFTPDGACELNYNNNKRAETYADGFKVPEGGELYIDGNAASGHCQLIMTRSDHSWMMTNQTYMRFYTQSGNQSSPNTNVFEIQNNGNLSAAGTLSENSDVSLKENVVTIPNALSKVKQLRGVEFDRKGTGVHEIGCIAQEVQSVLPELVKPRSYDDPLLTLSYNRFSAVLIEAVKELTAKVETLETKVAALEAG